MRRRRPDRRTINPDPVFGDLIVAKFINNLMKNGKKSIAEKIVYNSFDVIGKKEKTDEPLNVFNNIQALEKNSLINKIDENIEYKNLTVEDIINQEMSKKTYINEKNKNNLIGIQSQLWSETIINEKIF